MLVGYYAVIGGKLLPIFGDLGFLTPADGTDRTSQNVGKKLSLLATQ